MTIFLLIRHGETDWSLNDKYQLQGGYRDLPSLTPIGIKNAIRLSSNPILKKAELIITSPYTRAMQTAAILSKNTGLDIAVEFNLREWQPDLHLGITNQTQLQDAIDDYVKEKGVYPIGMSKSWEAKSAVKDRVEKVLKQYLNCSCVLVVTHEQVIKSWIDTDCIANCSFNEIEII